MGNSMNSTTEIELRNYGQELMILNSEGENAADGHLMKEKLPMKVVVVVPGSLVVETVLLITIAGSQRRDLDQGTNSHSQSPPHGPS
jgi:hypothetical protein